MTGSVQAITATVNGINCKSLEVCLTKTKKAETFHAVVALSDPAAQGLDADAGATMTCMINGAQIGGSFNLEHVDFDFDAVTISLSGRDAASALIDTPNTQTFTNQSPDQVIRSLASGVPVQVDSVGSQAGKIYQIDWNAITHRASSWDAIQNLADLFGKNAYVTGGTLYVKDIDEQLPPYALQYSPPTPKQFATGNFIKLTCSRNFQMSKQINVKVAGHNHNQKKTLSATAQAGGSGSGALNYSYVIPGATQDQLQNIATKKSKEHAKHAHDIEVEIPGDTSITARMSLQLSGTGTAFDKNYDVTDADHKVDWDGGYRTTMKGNAAGESASSSSSAASPGSGSGSGSGVGNVPILA